MKPVLRVHCSGACERAVVRYRGAGEVTRIGQGLRPGRWQGGQACNYQKQNHKSANLHIGSHSCLGEPVCL